MASGALWCHVRRSLHRQGLPQSVRNPSFSSGSPMETRRQTFSIGVLDALDHRFLVCRLLGYRRWIWLALLSMYAILLFLISALLLRSFLRLHAPVVAGPWCRDPLTPKLIRRFHCALIVARASATARFSAVGRRRRNSLHPYACFEMSYRTRCQDDSRITSDSSGTIGNTETNRWPKGMTDTRQVKRYFCK